MPLYRRAGVRLVLSGHEHNFQHSRADGIDYFVTGGGGKVRSAPPRDFVAAHTVSWAAACHFLLVKVEGRPGRGDAHRRGRPATGGALTLGRGGPRPPPSSAS